MVFLILCKWISFFYNFVLFIFKDIRKYFILETARQRQTGKTHEIVLFHHGFQLIQTKEYIGLPKYSIYN